MSRLLRRLGDIVDVAGMSLEHAAAAIAAARPDGILALADSLLLWTARSPRCSSSPFMTPEVAARLTDKYPQREALRAAACPFPASGPFPARRRAARGRARAGGELPGGAEAAARRRQQRHRAGRLLPGAAGAGRRDAPARPVGAPAELVLEEYLRDRPEAAGHHFADYVSVESFVSDGRISHLAITGRFPPAEPFRETGFFIPSAFDEDAVAAIADVATAAVAGDRHRRWRSAHRDQADA